MSESFQPVEVGNGQLYLPEHVADEVQAQYMASHEFTPNAQELKAQEEVMGHDGHGSIRNESALDRVNQVEIERRTNGRERSIKDMLDPRNIIDLKASFDGRVERFKDEKNLSVDATRDKDGFKANTEKAFADKLKQEMINSYTQVGVKKGEKPRQLPKSVISDINKYMNLSYDELESRIAKLNKPMQPMTPVAPKIFIDIPTPKTPPLAPRWGSKEDLAKVDETGSPASPSGASTDSIEAEDPKRYLPPSPDDLPIVDESDLRASGEEADESTSHVSALLHLYRIREGLLAPASAGSTYIGENVSGLANSSFAEHRRNSQSEIDRVDQEIAELKRTTGLSGTSKAALGANPGEVNEDQVVALQTQFEQEQEEEKATATAPEEGEEDAKSEEAEPASKGSLLSRTLGHIASAFARAPSEDDEDTESKDNNRPNAIADTRRTMEFIGAGLRSRNKTPTQETVIREKVSGNDDSAKEKVESKPVSIAEADRGFLELLKSRLNTAKISRIGTTETTLENERIVQQIKDLEQQIENEERLARVR
jgi:hypothetical protein